MTTKAIGARTYETQLLTDRLKLLQPDEVVTYAELSRIAGMDVGRLSKGYTRLASARRITESEAGFLLGPVAGVGIKRLPVAEQAALGPQSVGRLKRFTRRSFRRMALVEYDKLDRQQQAQHNLAASVVGVVQLFTKPKSIEKLSGAVEQTAAKLPIGDTLALFHANGEK